MFCQNIHKKRRIPKPDPKNLAFVFQINFMNYNHLLPAIEIISTHQCFCFIILR